MKNYLSRISLALLPILLLSWGHAGAGEVSEFHADARMRHAQQGDFDNAYGYMYALTDGKGRAAVNVMFSNGDRQRSAQFNARVRFVDTAGKVIEEQHFSRRIEAAGEEGAAERRLVRVFELDGFDAIEVDFYLTDPVRSEQVASAGLYGSMAELPVGTF